MQSARSLSQQLARTGSVKLRIQGPSGARVSVRVTAPFGRRTVRIATAKGTLKGGAVSLTVKLSKSARSRLKSHGRLTIHIIVALSSGSARTTTVTLKRGGAR